MGKRCANCFVDVGDSVGGLVSESGVMVLCGTCCEEFVKVAEVVSVLCSDCGEYVRGRVWFEMTEMGVSYLCELCYGERCGEVQSVKCMES